MRIRPRALLGNLIALAAGTLVMLAILEIGLRVAGLGHPYYSAPELYRPNPDPNVQFEPRPNFDGFSEGNSVQTNSRGLRERELAVPKTVGTTRIVFLGDSVTFGAGVLDHEAFPRLLEPMLQGSRPGPVETVNTAVVGYNTAQELSRLRDVGLAYQPDGVVLVFVVNDLLDTFSIFDHQYTPTDISAPLKVWLRRHSHLYRFVQDTYWRVALEMRRARTGQTEPLRPRARVDERLGQLGQIVDLAKSNGAPLFLVLYPDNLSDPVGPGADGQRRTVREELTRFAQSRGIPAFDLTEALGDVRDPRARQHRLREDPHPSPVGHRVIAEALSGPLREWVRGLPAR
jgi:lysophospholipase L1-like esterase